MYSTTKLYSLNTGNLLWWVNEADVVILNTVDHEDLRTAIKKAPKLWLILSNHIVEIVSVTQDIMWLPALNLYTICWFGYLKELT